MRYNKAICFILPVLLALTSCAQGKYGIKKVHAFTTERMPGNIPVEMPGEPVHRGPDTLLIVYMETKGSTASWDTAWLDNKSYSVSTNPVKEDLVEPGTLKANGNRVTIRKEAGNQLWVLYFTPHERAATPPIPVKRGQLLLGGRLGTKKVTQLVRPIKELESIPSV